MCEFCELYEYAKESAKKTKTETDMDTIFKIKLETNSCKNRIVKGVLTCGGMEFSYCPVCGRKLDEVSK